MLGRDVMRDREREGGGGALANDPRPLPPPCGISRYSKEGRKRNKHYDTSNPPVFKLISMPLYK